MLISELVEQRVALLGFGVEGRATLRVLRLAGLTDTVWLLADREPIPENEAADLGVRYAATPEEALQCCDVLVRSPGFAPHHPLRQLADRMQVRQTTATDVFINEARSSGVLVVGITGSKGKSTTSALLYTALRAAGMPAQLVGNIGVPALERLPALRAERAVAVMELSSYQCADLTIGPDVGVLLALFPEHMDYHGGVAAYYAAKLHMAQVQQPQDHLLYGQSAAEQVEAMPRPGNLVPVGDPSGVHYAEGWFWRGKERLCSTEGMQLPGLHNRQNAAAALAVFLLLGAPVESFRRALTEFRGLAFRLQDEGEHHGIRWINDSIATAPEATAAALKAFPQAVGLVVGGLDRGYSWDALVLALAESRVELLVTLPPSGEMIAEVVRAASLEKIQVVCASHLEQAVEVVGKLLPTHSLCLFSPGAPSYGVYGNFVERGQALQKLLRKLDQPLE